MHVIQHTEHSQFTKEIILGLLFCLLPRFFCLRDAFGALPLPLLSLGPTKRVDVCGASEADRVALARLEELYYAVAWKRCFGFRGVRQESEA